MQNNPHKPRGKSLYTSYQPPHSRLSPAAEQEPPPAPVAREPTARALGKLLDDAFPCCLPCKRFFLDGEGLEGHKQVCPALHPELKDEADVPIVEKPKAKEVLPGLVDTTDMPDSVVAETVSEEQATFKFLNNRAVAPRAVDAKPAIRSAVPQVSTDYNQYGATGAGRLPYSHSWDSGLALPAAGNSAAPLGDDFNRTPRYAGEGSFPYLMSNVQEVHFKLFESGPVRCLVCVDGLWFPNLIELTKHIKAAHGWDGELASFGRGGRVTEDPGPGSSPSLSSSPDAVPADDSQDKFANLLDLEMQLPDVDNQPFERQKIAFAIVSRCKKVLKQLIAKLDACEGPHWTTMSYNGKNWHVAVDPAAATSFFLPTLLDVCLSRDDLAFHGFVLNEWSYEYIDKMRMCYHCGKKNTPDIGECKLHPGLTRKMFDPNTKTNRLWYLCCGQLHSETHKEGCCVFALHSFEDHAVLARNWSFCRAPPRVPGVEKSKAVVIDCEMGGTHLDRSELIMLCATDLFTGQVLINQLVKPSTPVKDLRTEWSGVTQELMNEAIRTGAYLDGWGHARAELFRYIDVDTIIIGHAVHNDLQQLRLIHERIIDTSLFVPRLKGRKQSLKSLTWEILKKQVQRGSGVSGHNCLEDTMGARELVLWSLFHPVAYVMRAKKMGNQHYKAESGRLQSKLVGWEHMLSKAVDVAQSEIRELKAEIGRCHYTIMDLQDAVEVTNHKLRDKERIHSMMRRRYPQQLGAMVQDALQQMAVEDALTTGNAV
ncbi:hypothetical protein FN846DRAFT_953312 [Sphaerosporella brunnea]|uniref:Exonuclease domain-containing protein n=1 Tax=Sphaerosporella brunnea TaxID=1250544 RepID=A0A5J5EUR3_9PEZI|nr:hypothetical protein FN846DRAFT_953312 [Sphaerosporella brunnea]